jgi:hypothetical protein
MRSLRYMSVGRRISGKWSCKDGFPRGGTLEADLAFTPGLGGNIVSFEHVDRAPGSEVAWNVERSSESPRP